MGLQRDWVVKETWMTPQFVWFHAFVLEICSNYIVFENECL